MCVRIMKVLGTGVVAAGLLLAACGSAPSTGAASQATATAPASASGAAFGGRRGTGSATAGRFRGTGSATAAGFRGGIDLAAAATYLGLSVGQVQQDLQGGKSLAAIAQAQGKSVPGLQQALVAAAKARLDQAVSAGQMTAAQEQQQLQALTQRISQLVNRAATASATGA